MMGNQSDRPRETRISRRMVLATVSGLLATGGSAGLQTVAGESTEPQVLERSIDLIGTGDSDATNDATITVEDRTVVIEGVVVDPDEGCLDPTLTTDYDGQRLSVVGGGKTTEEDCPTRPDSVEYRAEFLLTSAPDIVVLDYDGVPFEQTWTRLAPLDGTVPRDIDDDGRHEDFNANGEIDFVDVNRFFRASEDPAVTDHVDAYDFTDDGTISLQDVMALFRMV